MSADQLGEILLRHIADTDDPVRQSLYGDQAHVDRGHLLDILRRIAEVGLVPDPRSRAPDLAEWPQVNIGQCYSPELVCRFCGGNGYVRPDHEPGCPALILAALREPAHAQ